MKRKFLSYQKEYWKEIKRVSKLLLFWEMRLGKTLVCIRWLITRPDCEKILIVCPLSVVESWVRELKLEKQNFTCLLGTTKQKEKIYFQAKVSGRHFFITNFATLVERGATNYKGDSIAKSSIIAKENFDAVVIDESTAIRKGTSKTTKVAIKQFRKVKYKAVLSGLPNPEGDEDYITQMLFCFGSFMGCDNFYTWREKNMVQLPFGGFVIKRKRKELIKQEIAKVSFNLTRKEAGIGSSKVRVARFVSVPAKIMKACNILWTDFEIGNKLIKMHLQALQLEARISGGFYEGYEHTEKLKELKYLLETELRGQKFIIWCRYTDEIEGVKKYLDNMKLKVLTKTIHGKTGKDAVKLNRERIDEFMAGKLQGLICQPKSIQMGIDLSIADVSIYYSRWPDYEINAQTSDRVIHPQKKTPVLEIDICCRGTSDAFVPAILEGKCSNANSFNEQLIELIKERRLNVS